MNTDDTTAPLRRPGMLYLHGGGFVRDSVNDAGAPACHLAATLPTVVVMVGYSLAPAVPFPTAPEDVYTALCCMANHADAWDIDHCRIVVAGHDAGGNLSTALSMIARGHGGLHLRTRVLITPILDPTIARVRPDRLANADNSAEVCTDCCRQYLPRPTEYAHPHTAPVKPRHLQGLPPALLLTALRGLLRTGAEHYVVCLIRAGVVAQVARVNEACHDSIAMNAVAQDEITCFLHWHLGIVRQATVLRKRRPRADRKGRTSIDPTRETPG